MAHTVGEAYELADAAHAGDDAKLLDELGDVLFQVHFLALLLEERGAGDLAAVAEHCTEKLIRRHPHVFGEVAVEGAADVAPQLGRDQAHQRGARRGRPVRRRAREPAGAVARGQGAAPRRRASGRRRRSPQLEASLRRLAAARGRDARFDELGELLFEAVRCARALDVDPSLRCARPRSAFASRSRPRAA